MKIAFITTDITNSGGTERVTTMIANYLSQHNHSVEIHSLSAAGSGPFYPVESGISVVYHDLSDYAAEPSNISKLIKKIKNTVRIRSVFNSINADVMIGTGKHINVYLTVFADRKKRKVIGCEHFAFNAPMSGVTKALRHYFYPKLDGLVVLTEKDRRYYQSFVPNVVCIPNAVPINITHEIDAADKVVLSVGRHTDQKGFDLLLTAWKKLEEQFRDWKLLIVGNGPLLPYHRQLAGSLNLKNVEFREPTRQIEKLYTSAGLYAMASRYEAFPMVLLEAMSCGIPCVAYNCDTGPAEIITEGKDGLIAKYQDEADFIEKLTALMSDDRRRLAMGKQAALSVKRYNMNDIGNMWLNFLTKI